MKTSVEALPTTLSSSFTDVKNAISGVSTKVDGISTDLSNGLAQVQDNISNTIYSTSSDIYPASYFPQTTRVKRSAKLASNHQESIVSVSGHGFLRVASIWPGAYKYKLTIIIDGVSMVLRTDGSSDVDSNTWLCSAPDIISIDSNYLWLTSGLRLGSSSGTTNTVDRPAFFHTILNGSDITKGKTFAEGIRVISDKYIEFNKSLSVLATNLGPYDSVYDAFVIYSLLS